MRDYPNITKVIKKMKERISNTFRRTPWSPLVIQSRAYLAFICIIILAAVCRVCAHPFGLCFWGDSRWRLSETEDWWETYFFTRCSSSSGGSIVTSLPRGSLWSYLASSSGLTLRSVQTALSLLSLRTGDTWQTAAARFAWKPTYLRYTPRIWCIHHVIFHAYDAYVPSYPMHIPKQ